MKRSKFLLIFIFLITVVLGGTAIWIGWRLSKEEEITPEEGEAAAWRDYYWCNMDGCSSGCGTRHNEYFSSYGVSMSDLHVPCVCLQADVPSVLILSMGPDPYRQVVGGECGEGYDCGATPRDIFDWDSCQSCKRIELVDYSQTEVTVSAEGWSTMPGIINCEGGGLADTCSNYGGAGGNVSVLTNDHSALYFKFTLYDGDGNIVLDRSGNPQDYELDKWNDSRIQCDGYRVLDRNVDPNDRVFECRVPEFIFSDLDLGYGTYTVEVSARKETRERWRHPDMLLTGANIRHEIPYQVGSHGGPYTYRELYNSSTSTSVFAWTENADNTCVRSFSFEQPSEDLQCDVLQSDVNLTTITEDELRAGDVTASLTTTITADNVTIGTTGYDYGASDTNFTINPDPNGATTTLTIPQGTSNGTYSLWVMVTGTGASGSVQSGCSSAADCVGGGEGCLLTFSVGEGSCDCESVTRSPSGDTIAAGSNVAFTMTAADQNGNECEVDASDVHWSTTGSPSLTELADSREPVSGEAVQHHIIYQIPEDASDGTQYCVSAIIDALGQVEACQNCFTIGGGPQPAFAAVKTSEVVCINNNTAARITYTIHVRNISDVAGVIEYVEDTYDSRFQSSWVSGITPSPDSHVGNVIRWDNDDLGYTLQANDGAAGGGDETEFSYIVTVPSEYFGTYEGEVFVPYQYRNDAIVKPENQDEIPLHTIVEIICAAVPTGIFNSAITSALIGLLFIMFGAVFLRMHNTTYKYLTPIEKTVLKAKEFYSDIRERILDRFKLDKKARFEKDAVRKIEKKK